jgi:membrane protein insertase Oxa1/YidC/SpoIIIJ
MIGLPGALVLYYAVSNLVAVVQQSYILRHDEDDLEELAEAAPAPKVTEKQPKKAKKGATVTRITAKDKGGKRRK